MGQFMRTFALLNVLIYGCFCADEKVAAIDWEGDSTKSVLHLGDDTLEDFLKENDKVLVMFYAPWCGHCKRMKPDYIELAKELNSGEQNIGKVVAVDCTQNKETQSKYGVRGYPTLKYFKDGQEFAPYKGQRTKDAMLEFMKSPSLPPTQPPEEDWSTQKNDVAHLTDQTFHSYIEEVDSVLVMFYAPWCGHCKKMKPEYDLAASILNTRTQGKRLAAIDCTKYPGIRDESGVKGYPTLKLYENGKYSKDYSGKRVKDDILKFMEYEGKWESKTPFVIHLDSEKYEEFIKKNDAIVLFYKISIENFLKINTAYEIAAIRGADRKLRTKFAIVDGADTANDGIVKDLKITEYPTIKHFSGGSEVKEQEIPIDMGNYFEYILFYEDQNKPKKEETHGGEL